MDILSNVSLLQKALDVSSLRQRVINNNIANVDTARYKSKDVSFEEILNAQKQNINSQNNLSFKGLRTDPRHFVIGQGLHISNQPKIVSNSDTTITNDKNNVDIETEMVKLAENNIWYSTLTQLTNKEFSMLRTVITEGRR